MSASVSVAATITCAIYTLQLPVLSAATARRKQDEVCRRSGLSWNGGGSVWEEIDEKDIRSCRRREEETPEQPRNGEKRRDKYGEAAVARGKSCARVRALHERKEHSRKWTVARGCTCRGLS